MRRGAAITAALWCALLCSAGADEARWHARLSTVPIDPATAVAVTGTGEATAELDGGMLIVTATYYGLQGAATIARLHVGRLTGVRGEPFADLVVTGASEGTVSGSIELTPQQIESLRDGLVYIQVHSTAAPDGNLWGWLL